MNGKEVEKKFHIHLNVLRATFNVPCKVISDFFFVYIIFKSSNVSSVSKAKMQI
jgi:hypothetical protein